MKKLHIIALLGIWFSLCAGFVNGAAPETAKKKKKKTKQFTVAFYNVENLFDTQNDPAINDEEFLPDGDNKWGERELKIKLDNLAKAIAQLGDADGPEILGLAEIENKAVLEMLVAHPRLKKHKYKIVHHDSPDQRGIDVAMLYKGSAFQTLYQTAYPVPFPENGDIKTRDLLLVKGIAAKHHELTLIINHWPSRSGGATESAWKRGRAAATLKSVSDSIFELNNDANVIIMGDFNDEPTDPSMKDTLLASATVKAAFFTHLYNPYWDLLQAGRGTLMYNKQFDLFDQMIVSEPLTREDNPLRYLYQSAGIYNPDWMQVESGDWKGAPRRSYISGKFKEDGFSDHFPVYLYLSY